MKIKSCFLISLSTLIFTTSMYSINRYDDLSIDVKIYGIEFLIDGKSDS